MAVYFGVESALPLACALVKLVKLTRSWRDAVLATVGLPTRNGAPTVIAGEAVDAPLVPTPFVAFTVHVYLRFNVALLTVIAVATEPVYVPDFVAPPLLDTHDAVYFVIVEPPLLVGAL